MGDKPTIRELINSSAAAAETKRVLLKWVEYRMNEGDAFNRVQVEALILAAETAESEYGKMAVVSVVSDCIMRGNKILFWDRLSRFKKLDENEKAETVKTISREHKESDLERMKREWAKLTGETEG